MFLTSICKRTGNWGVHSIIPKAIFKDGMTMDDGDAMDEGDDGDEGDTDEPGGLDGPPEDFEDSSPDESSAMILVLSNSIFVISTFAALLTFF